MSTRTIALLLFASSVLVSSVGQAFPELVRTGYANCITCHVSPSGGGTLTEYGRALSGDRLSTWTQEGEEQFAYGIAPKRKWLSLGGDFRSLLLGQNRPNRQIFQAFVMQADLEAAVTVGKIQADATAGVDYVGNPISRRHYVIYRPTDQLSFRAGRFLPAVGVNTENHSIALRRGIGRDQSTETYNLEGAWIDQNFDVFATAVFGRPDNTSLGAEVGGALSGSVFFGNRFKIGASYFYGRRAVAQRHVVGPYFILGFTDRFFLMVDTAYQILNPANGAGSSGFADYARLDYEVTQGLHVYVTQELSNLDTAKPGAWSDAYGLGVQWFPRPHFEVNVMYQKNRFGGTNQPLYDYGFAMLHFYP